MSESTDQRPVPITIDGKSYEAPRARLTGREIRELTNPPVSDSYDLFLTVAGAGDDIKVDAVTPYDLLPQMNFYSAPKTINPGEYDGVA